MPPKPPPQAAVPPSSPVISPTPTPEPAAPEASAPVAEMVVGAREMVQETLIEAGVTPLASEVDPADFEYETCAEKLITRWEVGSERAYTRLYNRVLYPGGVSGPTWGLGWDGGHQTRIENRRVWVDHPSVGRLETTAGVTGKEAERRIGEWAGIGTPFPYARQVFKSSSLPSYTAKAEMSFTSGLRKMPVGIRCALVSVVYNRGHLTAGPNRLEYRVIRDTCIKPDEVPNREQCVADQLLAMKRLWPTNRGLRARRDDEARVALSGRG